VAGGAADAWDVAVRSGETRQRRPPAAYPAGDTAAAASPPSPSAGRGPPSARMWADRTAWLWFTLAALAAAGTSATGAAPRFSNVFASRMVLQRDEAIEIWGFGSSSSSFSAATRLVVTLGNASAAATAATDGSIWHATLPAMPATTACASSGGEGLQLQLKQGQHILQTLHDICVGDLYLFSGQSNIDIPEAYGHQFDPAAQSAEEQFAEEHGAALRIMIVPNQVHGLNYTSSPARELADVPDCQLCAPPFGAGGGEPYQYCQCNSLRWARANSSNIRGFSATAWFTGAAILRAATETAEEAVPIGLLRSSWGGTKIREWSSPTALAKCPGTAAGGKLFASMIQPFVGLKFKAVICA
jgi:sialate O-acetylesterase